MPKTYLSKSLKAVAAFIFIFGIGAATLYTVSPSISDLVEQNARLNKKADSVYNAGVNEGRRQVLDSIKSLPIPSQLRNNASKVILPAGSARQAIKQ